MWSEEKLQDESPTMRLTSLSLIQTQGRLSLVGEVMKWLQWDRKRQTLLSESSLSGKVVRLRTREGNTVPVSLTVRQLADNSRVMVLLEPVTRYL